jgi:FeS assembly SUF system regulator
MMRMTKQADYAIVLMSYFARTEEGLVLSARDLAAQAKLPVPTVTKLLKILARADLLTSHRGLRGGYALQRTPEQISVADIIAAIEGPIAMTQCCENARGCRQEPTCPIGPNWRLIDTAVRGALGQVSLAEMSGRLGMTSVFELTYEAVRD